MGWNGAARNKNVIKVRKTDRHAEKKKDFSPLDYGILKREHPSQGCYDEAYNLTTPSAPLLAINGSDGWYSTSKTPSLAFSRCVVSSCTHDRDPSKSQNRTEQS